MMINQETHTREAVSAAFRLALVNGRSRGAFLYNEKSAKAEDIQFFFERAQEKTGLNLYFKWHYQGKRLQGLSFDNPCGDRTEMLIYQTGFNEELAAGSHLAFLIIDCGGFGDPIREMGILTGRLKDRKAKEIAFRLYGRPSMVNMLGAK